MYCLKYVQKIPLSLEDAWTFFSCPTNLKILTPDYLKFTMVNSHGNQKIYAGQIIAYTIRPFLNISLEWVTEITHVNEHRYFIDEQRFGPYKFWHHEHHFIPIQQGVEMTDFIYYKLPFGIVGKVINSVRVEKDIKAIFSFRRAKLENLFG